jgi:hypothetical protein
MSLENMHPPFHELQARLNKNTVDFLRTELELGFTFVKTAEIEARMNNTEHFDRARKYSESAVETICRFAPRIMDSHARGEILQGADELQKRIASLCVGTTPRE